MGHPDLLIVNAGSSSLKLALRPTGQRLTIERIGEAGHLPDHQQAWRQALQELERQADLGRLRLVVHRVVHGGERYTEPTVIDDQVLRDLGDTVQLAPLHNPANLAALRAAMASLPSVPHVAVFDTAFHAGMAPRAFRYAVPEAWYREQGIRRYGFHGPSHDGVSRRAAELLGRPREELRIISMHLGNGASAAAIDRGRSVETTMGFTPLDGLVMGTRSGAIDPGVLLHLLRGGMPLAELDRSLHRDAGLLGLSGLSNDVRDLRAAAAQGHDGARLALEVFAYRLRLAVGSLAFAMGGLDALVFTGGIGEHDAETRASALAGLASFGIEIDQAHNSAGAMRIDRGGPVAILVIATDEDGMMAQEALRAMGLTEGSEQTGEGPA